jgi:hypothetical protein
MVTGAVAVATQPTVVVSTTTPVVAVPPPPVAPPCSVAPTSVGGVAYYQCGATWYTAGYGGSGVVYMPVPPPG